jgi:hypothetical protein
VSAKLVQVFVIQGHDVIVGGLFAFIKIIHCVFCVKLAKKQGLDKQNGNKTTEKDVQVVEPKVAKL